MTTRISFLEKEKEKYSLWDPVNSFRTPVASRSIGDEHRDSSSTETMGNPVRKYAIVACARWENNNIIEWIVYHQSIGFGHFYIYCNDDSPVDLYERLLPFLVSPRPIVTFLHFSVQGQQSRMLLHFLSNFAHESEWVMFLDVDEFLHLPRHHDIDKFLLSIEVDTDLIYFNWLVFGNSGFDEHPAYGTLANYIRRSRAPHVNTKTLIRTVKLDKRAIEVSQSVHFWHDWGEEIARTCRAVNVLGEPMHEYYRNFPDGAMRFLGSGDRCKKLIDTAIINHYAFRSEREFIRRFERGVGGEFSGQRAWKEVHESGAIKEFLKPLNEVEDRGLQRYWICYLERAWDSAMIPRPPGYNIALGGRATQSSSSSWSTSQDRSEDASGAISGRITNSYQCHTDLEWNPWWQLDLGSTRTIVQVRIYNRCEHRDLAGRARNLKIEVSNDGMTWNEIFRRYSENPFGGVDGNPLIVALNDPISCVFIRITLLDLTYLHFDQVEVYEYKTVRILGDFPDPG